MKIIKIRSIINNDILRAIPIISSNIADFLENGYNVGIGDWIIVGRNSSWVCPSDDFKNYYKIIEAEKGEEAMKTKNFTVTGITVHSSYGIVPRIDIEVRAESLDFANGNKVVTAEKLKDIIESKLNNTFSVVPPIKKVIFNNPATIVFWTDGTKTVVKCAEGDTFSEYAGLSMCITKKLLGNDFKKEMNKWCKSGDKPKKETSVVDGFIAAANAMEKCAKLPESFDKHGTI